MSGISNCPAEIVDNIIGHIDAWRYDSFFLPQSSLTPLLRVCKTWKSLAERRLYQSISIGSDLRYIVVPGADRGFNAQKRHSQKIAQDLLYTLRHNSRLALLVRSLRLSTDNFKTRELSQEYICIFRLCSNVDSLELRGYHPEEARAFVDVLSQRSLVHLVVHGVDRSGGDCGPLCTSEKLLEMMFGWPDLKRVHFYKALSSTPYHVQPAVPRPHKLCPQLSQLSTIDIPFRPEITSHQLCDLLNICPQGIRKLHISISEKSDSVAALCECLHAWAPTLVDLRVEFPKASPNTLSLSSAISQLTSLKRLHVVSVMVPASCLAPLPRLYELFYYSKRTGIEDLALVLAKLKNLPSLRILNCILPFDGKSLTTPYEQIERMCSTRNVVFTISTSRALL